MGRIRIAWNICLTYTFHPPWLKQWEQIICVQPRFFTINRAGQCNPSEGIHCAVVSAYMRQWIGSALFQIMAWRLFGAMPISKPMMGYCQMDHQEQISVKIESKFSHFHSRKCVWKCCLQNMTAILFRGGWVNWQDVGIHECSEMVWWASNWLMTTSWYDNASAVLDLSGGNPPDTGVFWTLRVHNLMNILHLSHGLQYGVTKDHAIRWSLCIALHYTYIILWYITRCPLTP